MRGSIAAAILRAVLLGTAGLLGAPTAQPGADVAHIGPQVGSTVPAFSGVDQFGQAQTLESALGPKGAMLVFFRSADW